MASWELEDITQRGTLGRASGRGLWQSPRCVPRRDCGCCFPQWETDGLAAVGVTGAPFWAQALRSWPLVKCFS